MGLIGSRAALPYSEDRITCMQIVEKIEKHWLEHPDKLLPILYSEQYNLAFMGLEKLHPFDSKKWGNIFRSLQESHKLSMENTVVSNHEPSRSQLLEFQTEKYLDKLKSSTKVAMVCEVPPLAILPSSVVDYYLLRKLRLQTGGTIAAAALALKQKWAINIGGGFHHAHEDDGGGFCAYADISGALKTLKKGGRINRAAIIDLDAHQGNGHERDFLKSDWVWTFDAYNRMIYPGDHEAKEMKQLTKLEFRPFVEDGYYLTKVEEVMDKFFDQFHVDEKPDIIAYNAGTDVMKGDPLGMMSITPQGIINRDELVFKKAKDLDIPIFMVTSGGYQSQTAEVIADSIRNLQAKGLLPGRWPLQSVGHCDAAAQSQSDNEKPTSEALGSAV